MYDIYLDIMEERKGGEKREKWRRKRNARTSSGTAFENFMIAS